MVDLEKLLKTLTETPGPSGAEQTIAAAVGDAWRPYVDSLTIDRIGTLLAIKPGQGDAPRPSLLIAAHMDEIGLMVKSIDAYPQNGNGYGFLRVTSIGGVDVRHLLGQMVVVHGRKQGDHDLPGVIGALPARMQPDHRHDKAYGYDALLVDVGLSAAQLREWVDVGDFITFRQPLHRLLGKRVAGKSLDNRASVAALTVCLEQLQQRQHAWDIIAAATAQEETALLGAATSAFARQPDVALAIDVTFGEGPGANDEQTFGLGEGPTIGLGPNVHPGVYQALKAAAEALEMKVHPEPHAHYSGTDAMALHIARAGIPTGVVGIPLRYMHTMVESADLRDIERAGRLIAEFAARLDDQFLTKIATSLLPEK
ncbi:MAG: M42 family metallopeptidase [Candidatus Promineifilaceae bacterium]